MTSGDAPDDQGNGNSGQQGGDGGNTETTDTYTAVADTEGKNPAEEGWYEKDGDEYSRTEDTTPTDGKTYYTKG